MLSLCNAQGMSLYNCTRISLVLFVTVNLSCRPWVTRYELLETEVITFSCKTDTDDPRGTFWYRVSLSLIRFVRTSGFVRRWNYMLNRHEIKTDVIIFDERNVNNTTVAEVLIHFLIFHRGSGIDSMWLNIGTKYAAESS